MAPRTSFCQAHADAICGRIAEGESLRAICQTAKMPAQSTIFRWLADPANTAFREQYARAREAQTEFWAHEIIDIADTPQEGERTEEGVFADGTPYTKTHHEDMLGHRRLQVDARKWLMSKLAPKKYGDKLELGGSVGIHEDALDALK